MYFGSDVVFLDIMYFFMYLVFSIWIVGDLWYRLDTYACFQFHINATYNTILDLYVWDVTIGIIVGRSSNQPWNMIS